MTNLQDLYQELYHEKMLKEAKRMKQKMKHPKSMNISSGSKLSSPAILARREKIRQRIQKGMTYPQVAKELGTTRETVANDVLKLRMAGMLS